MTEIRANTKPSSLRRLARLTLVLGLIATATPAYAANPKPDPAPVAPSPPPAPVHTFTPPVTTRSSPTTTTVRTTSRTHATSPARRKKRVNKPRAVTTKSKPARVTADPQPTGVSSISNSGSTLSEALHAALVVLAGLGVAGTLIAVLGILYLASR